MSTRWAARTRRIPHAGVPVDPSRHSRYPAPVFMSEAITRGIRVRVQSSYVPERSEPERGSWFFIYTVEVANQARTYQRATLDKATATPGAVSALVPTLARELVNTLPDRISRMKIPGVNARP